MGRITAIARLPTPATCLTALATPHLTAPTAAATHLTAPTATPHRTVITDRPATTGGLSGFSTEGARCVDSSAPPAKRAGDNPPARRINRRVGALCIVKSYSSAHLNLFLFARLTRAEHDFIAGRWCPAG